MPASHRISAAQYLVLNSAAERSDRMVLPLPAVLKARGNARRTLLQSLVNANLVEELPVSDEALCWRREADGRRLSLRLTAGGLAAARGQQVMRPEAPFETGFDSGADEPPTIALNIEAANAGDLANKFGGKSPPETKMSRPRGKLGQVLDAVTGEAGASLKDLVTLTGWQAHTARAALTGLRKRGFAVQLIEQDGRKAYRLGIPT